MSRNKVGVPYQTPLRYVGPNNDLIPIVLINRIPTSNDDRFPLGQFWLVGDNPTTGTVGDLYYLCDYLAGVPQWCLLDVSAAGPGIETILTDEGAPPVPPDASAVLTLGGGVGITTSGTGPGTTVTIDLDVPVTVPNGGTGATTLTDGGILLGSGTGAVTVTAQPIDGQVLIGSTGLDPVLNTITAGTGITIVNGAGTITISAAGGGVAMDSIMVDNATGPGVNPVVPTAAGLVTVAGAVVAAHSIPIETHSRAIYEYNIEVQYAAAAASTTGTSSGVAHFDDLDFGVDASGFVTLDNPPTVGGPGATNIGFNYDGGTGVFTISSKDGTALSATNVARVTVPSQASFGELVTIDVTADQSFIDDVGASEIIGNLFGLTTGIAWSNDMPFFVYAVPNDDEDAIAFMISRSPAAKVSPAAANIGAPDDPVADAQADFWSLDSLDETLYDSNPCVCIGAFRMQMSASDDWTVQALDSNDGPGNYLENATFTMGEGLMGAAAGTYVLANAGTEPEWPAQTITYSIGRDGMTYIRFEGQTADVAGVGANDISIVLPYAPVTKQVVGIPFIYTVSIGTTRRVGTVGILTGANSTSTNPLSGFVLDSATANLTNAAIALNNSLQFVAYYRAFT